MVEKRELMEVFVYKTNVINESIGKKLMNELKKQLELFRVTLDLEDCDKVLRIEAVVINSENVEAIALQNGVSCQELTW